MAAPERFGGLGGSRKKNGLALKSQPVFISYTEPIDQLGLRSRGRFFLRRSRDFLDGFHRSAGGTTGASAATSRSAR